LGIEKEIGDMARKFIQTIKICSNLFMARTFGEYIHSGWNGRFDYVSYRWRNRVYDIPKGPVDEEGFY
jgi:hypothetical protein